MKRGLTIVLLAAVVAGCVHRVALYAPRRTATDEHRAAQTNADCLACHGDSLRASHERDDDCMNCHKLCRGC